MLPNGQFRFVFHPKNYEAAVAFYRDGLQLPIDHDWDFGGGDRGTVFIAGAGMIELIGLLPGAEYVAPAGGFLLVQVDDADRWHALAQERGLTIAAAPVSYPWGHRIVRLTDPDGLGVSLFSEI